MYTLFALLSLVAFIAAVVGVIRPTLVLPGKLKLGNLPRLKAFVGYTVASFVLAGLSVSLEPPEVRQERLEKQAAAQAAAEADKVEQQRIAAEHEAVAARNKANAEKAASERAALEEAVLSVERGKGIGVGRAVAFMVFNDKYNIKPSSNVGNLERWMGKADMGAIELLGAENDLSAMTVVIGVDQDDLAGSISRLGDMLAALRLAFPTWEGSNEWLFNAVARLPTVPQQELVRDGLRISISAKPGIGLISLSIDSRNV